MRMHSHNIDIVLVIFFRLTGLQTVHGGVLLSVSPTNCNVPVLRTS